MQIGLLGLGKMGANMARRMARGGVSVLAWNRSVDVATTLAQTEPNVTACADMVSMVARMASPRVLWLMLPAGAATETAMHQLADLLSPGDIVVCLGAGTISQWAYALPGQLAELSKV